LGRFSVREFKNTKKSMSKTFSEKIDDNFDVSFSAVLGVLSRFRVFFSDGSSKPFTKIVSKSFYKKTTDKTNPYFLDFFLSRVWAFLGEGRTKTRQKTSKKN
jgi:hypothetical protein